jgi:glycosyltransferase involved in cell wall biosynthesis
VRILILVHQFYPEYTGGTEKVTYGLAKLAQRAGHFVRILTCVTGDMSDVWQRGSSDSLWNTAYDGIPITGIKHRDISEVGDYSLEFNEPLVEEVGTLLAIENFDICHVMHSMRMTSAIQAVSNHGLPYILSLTDFYLPCYRINLITQSGKLCKGADGGYECAKSCLVPEWESDTLIRRYNIAHKIIHEAKHIVCPSEFVAEQFRREYLEVDFTVIPHGIDLASFKMDFSEKESKGLVFGYLGSMNSVKGIDVLISAFRKVESKEATLHLVGGFFGDVEFEKKLKKLAKGDDRIRFFSPVSSEQVFEVLQSFDVICIPSVVPETFSLVLHEATAARTPALVSSLGAPKDYIERNKSGSVVNAGDVDAWRNQLREIINKPQLIEEWRENLPLPLRTEEEAFFYQTIYKKSIG